MLRLCYHIESAIMHLLLSRLQLKTEDKANRKFSRRPRRRAEAPKKKLRRYDVAIYDSFHAARAAKTEIQEKCRNCDQFNLVIKAEGNMDDPELLEIDQKVKVFAGTAWTTIHERRIEDDWYKELQE